MLSVSKSTGYDEPIIYCRSDSLVGVIGRLYRVGQEPKVLRVGFVPAEDAQQVMQNAQPVVEILRKQLGMEIQPFVATDYTGVVEALRVNKLDVAFLSAGLLRAGQKRSQRQSRAQVRAQGHSVLLCRDHHARRQRHQDARRSARQDVSPSAIRCRPPAMCFRARCSKSTASTRCATSNRFSTPAATTPPCWRCSTAKSTPARPTPTRRTARTPPGCVT